MKLHKGMGIFLMGMIVLSWTAACAGTGDMMDAGKGDTMMTKTMDGMFTAAKGHHAAGKAEITKGMGGNSKLVLSDLGVDKVPDGRVYLAKDGDYAHGIEVGKLTQFTGTVSFDLPPGTDTAAYDSVVIWCKKFNVEIGRAYLPKQMM
jgi:hypothetical protein